MITVTIPQAKEQLSRLIAEAEAGEDVIIARDGEPVARLVPLHPRRARVFGALKDIADIGPEFFEPLPASELDAWEGA